MSERVLTVGGSKASKPITDFLMSNEYFGPKGGVYYVDGNVAATGGGSPDHPYATLAEAITASNAAIALSANRWWARRNRIYACGDTLAESLVAYPTKCDVIGCGSDDGFPMAGILGNHIPVNSAMGTRFFNFRFIPVSATPIISLGATAGNSEYYDCLFDSSGTLTATIGILLTAASWVKIVRNKFVPSGGAGFSTAAIDIATGASHGTLIEGNRIYSAAKGIRVNSGFTGVDSWILDNKIKSTLACIDDQAGSFHVVGNRGITLAAAGTAGAGAVVCNQFLSSDNEFTASNLCFTYPLLHDADGTP